MATVPEDLHESATTAGARRLTALGERLDGFPPRLLTGLLAAFYVGLLAGSLLVATVAAVSLAIVVPGTAGVVVFLTVGVGLVCAVPVVARRLFVRAVGAMDLDRAVADGPRDLVRPAHEQSDASA